MTDTSPAPGHYRSNLRDLEFVLFEVLGRDAVLGHPPYQDLDAETARSVLDEVERLATHELAASLLDSDRNPPVYDPATSTVTLPASFAASYRAYREAEWWRLDVPPALGGTPCPPSLRWAVQELVLGANPAIHMYACGPAFAGVLHTLGTPDQQRLAALMVGPRLGVVDGPWPSPTRAPTSARAAPARASSPTARGTSRASSGSSPTASTTSPRTSSTSCSPAPRAPAPARRACRCSPSRSTTSTSTPARSVRATACAPPTSSTRWACACRPPAS